MALMRNFAGKTDLRGHLQGLFSKDQDKDKDFILVLKESLKTRTRTNITAEYS